MCSASVSNILERQLNARRVIRWQYFPLVNGYATAYSESDVDLEMCVLKHSYPRKRRDAMISFSIFLLVVGAIKVCA